MNRQSHNTTDSKNDYSLKVYEDKNY